MQDIISDEEISIPARQPLVFQLPAPFKVTDSMFAIKHKFESGELRVKLSNAEGFSVTDNFKITPSATLFVAFEQDLVQDDVEVNDVEFTDVELFSSTDVDGSFSFGKGYSADFVSQHRGAHIRR